MTHSSGSQSCSTAPRSSCAMTRIYRNVSLTVLSRDWGWRLNTQKAATVRIRYRNNYAFQHMHRSLSRLSMANQYHGNGNIVGVTLNTCARIVGGCFFRSWCSGRGRAEEKGVGPFFFSSFIHIDS